MLRPDPIPASQRFPRPQPRVREQIDGARTRDPDGVHSDGLDGDAYAEIAQLLADLGGISLDPSIVPPIEITGGAPP